MGEVRASRAGGAKYLLRAEGDERVWHTRQFAFKAGELVPWWFEEGRTWHLWAGEEDSDAPPLGSFGSMGEVKERVARLVAGGAGGG